MTSAIQTPPFTVEELPLRHTAVVHVTCVQSTMKDAVDAALADLNTYLERTGVARSPEWFMRYFQLEGLFTPGEPVEFEVGVEVPTPIAGEGRVLANTLPAGRAAVGLHAGAYDTIAETYMPFHTWIVEQGLTLNGPHWEQYLIDGHREPDPARWLTRIVQPV